MRAVLFDLYGTILQVGRPVFQRRARRLLGADRRAWTRHVLEVLLVTPFDSREAFVDHLVSVFSPAAGARVRRELLDHLEEELASARAFPGVPALLGFLRRRGLRLGLLSNLASPYRGPVADLGLADCFDAVAYSCDRGHAKPAARIYLDLCAELGVEPDQALMVGDSMRNDVAAPRRLGIRSLWVKPDGEDKGPPSAFQVGWLDAERGGRALVEAGTRLAIAGEPHALGRLRSVADEEQGRYNLVATAAAHPAAGGAQRTIYLKRYLLPASAHLEAFTHELMALAGVDTPTVGILPGGEPVLWSLEAAGRKVDRLAPSPELAFDIGRHGACAYLFANADYRPRNAFLVAGDGQARLVMVDYEHCLFNLALDTSGVADPSDPRQLEALGDAELRRRIRKRVITPRTCRRNYREFFGRHGARPELIEPFREGWTALTRRVQQCRGRLEELLRRRVGTPPYLILGTRAYRRAMLGIDVEDLLARVDEDPQRVLDGWMQPAVGTPAP